MGARAAGGGEGRVWSTSTGGQCELCAGYNQALARPRSFIIIIYCTPGAGSPHVVPPRLAPPLHAPACPLLPAPPSLPGAACPRAWQPHPPFPTSGVPQQSTCLPPSCSPCQVLGLPAHVSCFPRGHPCPPLLLTCLPPLHTSPSPARATCPCGACGAALCGAAPVCLSASLSSTAPPPSVTLCWVA